MDFIVAATDNVVVDGQASATKFGQNLIGEFLEASGKVANLLLALFGVAVHRQHAEDDILILNVAGLHEFLESFPVLGGVAGVDVGIHIHLLQLATYVALGGILALFCQLGVELERTFGRSVSRNLDIVELIALLVVLNLAQGSEEVLHGNRLEFAGANIGLVNQIPDLCLLGLGDSVLVSVLAESHIGGSGCAAYEHRSGDNTVGHLNGVHLHRLVAYACIEGEVEFALLHGGLIRKGVAHRIVATHLIGNFLIVAQHTLTLEGCGLTLGFSALIAKHGNNSHDRLLLHVLLGEATIDGHGHLARHSLKRRGRYGEVVGREIAKFAARREHEAACQRDGQIQRTFV